MYNRYQKLPIDIDLDLIRDTTHCMPIQFMHTCLIISLHGVVLFVGDYRNRRQIYVHM